MHGKNYIEGYSDHVAIMYGSLIKLVFRYFFLLYLISFLSLCLLISRH